MRLKLIVFVVLILLTPLAFTQSLISPIEDAHGGAAFLRNLSAYSISGTLHRRDGTSLPFTLTVQGDNSRFETNEGVSIYNGDIQQWWEKGGHKSQAGYSFHGGQEIYLSPFYVAAQLNKYQFKGRDKGDVFTRKPKYQRFLNYEPDTPVIDLEFDEETHRLTAITFCTEEEPSAGLTLTFAEYRKYGGVLFPSKVTQQAGGEVDVTLEIVSVDLNPVFPSDTFTIEH